MNTEKSSTIFNEYFSLPTNEQLSNAVKKKKLSKAKLINSNRNFLKSSNNIEKNASQTTNYQCTANNRLQVRPLQVINFNN